MIIGNFLYNNNKVEALQCCTKQKREVTNIGW